MQNHHASSSPLFWGTASRETSPARQPLPSPKIPSPKGGGAGRGSFAIPYKQTLVLLRLENVWGK